MSSSRYEERRRHIDRVFIGQSPLEGSAETHVSPSGEYSLEVSVYSSGPRTWDYSRGVVRRTSDHAVVADVKRNYGSFWHAWVSHPNGNEYLLCGEDYQGYNVIELQSGQNRVHFPAEAYNGTGFCWVVVHPSPDGLTLAVDGCYWACPYELVFFDFAEPMALPLKELARIDDFEETVGWDAANAFSYLSGEDSGKQSVTWERVRASTKL